ncbi:cobalt transporter [Acinetobacter colistiniresistens]|uniref:cobalt transporter n=1 Tax=Acinetobacter colistiniresistens TaxID=280145 RepID=UPI00211BB4B3|nr:cobalt transporter [Acinetobacter colistiniresistens]UUM27565.1 cobalt transporter [Acinetobacter colistiniresistens]
MALEQQHNPIIDKANPSTNLREKVTGVSASQLELIPADGSMHVSFYYIPHMSSAVEVLRVRKALLPFSDQLIEHSIDLEARHLALYHQDAIPEVTVALQGLNLGAELQQTMPHYEPMELATSKQHVVQNKYEQQDENVFSLMQQFFSAAIERFKQWIRALRNKQDQ